MSARTGHGTACNAGVAAFSPCWTLLVCCPIEELFDGMQQAIAYVQA